MVQVLNDIRMLVQQALIEVCGPEYSSFDPVVRFAADSRFGDVQINCAMQLAKTFGKAPREIAEKIAQALPQNSIIVKTEIAGPGFINITLADAYIGTCISAMLNDSRCGIPESQKHDIIAIDYSAPNVAKEMHIGHLRSTIIGDALVRILEFLGHTVLKRNHLGDWGTQFGMLIENLVDTSWDLASDHQISDLNALYQEAKQRFDTDPAFAERARKRVVLLQSGDETTLKLWRALIEESKRHFAEIYHMLDVTLEESDYYPESFYNDMLPGIVQELLGKGIAVMSNGAVCVFIDEITGKNKEPVPLIVQKSDGGFGYDTTDLAAIRHRILDLHASRLLYVVGAPQAQHFAMIFAAAKKAGWLQEPVRAEHVAFGSILGEDGKPFKTRSGESVKLYDVLTEAINRAFAIVHEKAKDIPLDEQKKIAQAIGIGAVKYADLSNDRVKDYVFNWDRMLSFDGNTAPYLQNAYVRIKSIFRKAGLDESTFTALVDTFAVPEERQLALELLKAGDYLHQVERSLEPHRLCGYLYNLASLFHAFYEKCPVLTAAPHDKQRRLALAKGTAQVLELCMGLLGIHVIDRM
ncbi:MAG TPA: arginine--tRNA ligase [Spirochaetia bacterium]|nr:arginine--tRNA ligase [Spirochaetales bacterium]HRS65534.1 arginine--tRNA ligase [Spirochaetia bacterium]HRV28407.1 arginine--tRNA ligase [Spirochaetia bacterium]